MGSYDDGEHTPKLLPCSHTLCRACLIRIAATSVPLPTGTLVNPNGIVSANSNSHNSLSRSVAAADSAAAIVSGNNNSSPFSSTSLLNINPVVEHCFKACLSLFYTL
jgi:hypothetical protein